MNKALRSRGQPPTQAGAAIGAGHNVSVIRDRKMLGNSPGPATPSSQTRPWSAGSASGPYPRGGRVFKSWTDSWDTNVVSYTSQPRWLRGKRVPWHTGYGAYAEVVHATMVTSGQISELHCVRRSRWERS